MYLLDFSKRVSDFIDVADDNGNIRNSKLELQYLNQIDNACKKAEITVGAVYPIAGNGNNMEESFSYNFLKPSEFKIDWVGSWIFNEFGAQPENINGNYANTHLIPSQVLNLNSTHVSYYANAGSIGEMVEIGITDDGGRRITLGVNFSGLAISQHYFYGGGSGSINYPNNTINGHYIGVRDRINNIFLIKNSETLIKSSEVSSIQNLPEVPIYLNAIELSGNPYFSDRRCAFASIGYGLPESKAKSFSHDIFIAQRVKGRA